MWVQTQADLGWGLNLSSCPWQWSMERWEGVGMGRRPILAEKSRWLSCLCLRGLHGPLPPGKWPLLAPWPRAASTYAAMSLQWLRAYTGIVLFPHFLPPILFNLLKSTSLSKCFKCQHPALKYRPYIPDSLILHEWGGDVVGQLIVFCIIRNRNHNPPKMFNNLKYSELN